MVKPVCKGLKRGHFLGIVLFKLWWRIIYWICHGYPLIDVSIGDRFHCMNCFMMEVSLHVNIDTGIIWKQYYYVTVRYCDKNSCVYLYIISWGFNVFLFFYDIHVYIYLEWFYYAVPDWFWMWKCVHERIHVHKCLPQVHYRCISI